MIFLIAIFLFSAEALSSDVPRSWIEVEKTSKSTPLPHEKSINDSSLFTGVIQNMSDPNLSDTGVEKIQNLISSHQSIAERLQKKIPALRRLDVGLGVNSSGDIGIFSFGQSRAIELVWKKNEAKSSKIADKNLVEQSIVLSPFDSVEDIHKQLKTKMSEVVDFQQINGPISRKILKTLYGDAKKINILVQSLMLKPRLDSWYIDRFWRNYYFSTSFGISDVLTVGYDKRVRFRFDFNPIPFRVENRVLSQNHALVQYMEFLNQMSRRENSNGVFELRKSRAAFDVEVGFDLFFLSNSVGRGFVIEFKRDENLFPNFFEEGGAGNLATGLITKMTRSLNNIIALNSSSESPFPLAEVRYSFGLSSETDLILASLEKATTIELHYHRINQQVFEFVENDNEKSKTNSIVEIESDSPLSLAQIDYRRRLSFTFDVPYINRVRIRPSLEYRYQVRTKK